MWMEHGGKRVVGGRDGRGVWGGHEVPGGGCGEGTGSGETGEWGSGVGAGSQKVQKGEECPPRSG